MMERISQLPSTHWVGECELWLDPLGDDVSKSECSLFIEGNKLAYSWQHKGQEQRGTLLLTECGAEFTDTFHSERTMACQTLPDVRGLLQVQGTYGPQVDWGWRIALVYRDPLDQLVLQMTNIAPWGEEARAVRFTLRKR